MPSGYISPHIHINSPRPHRPSLWLRFRTWWKATDRDSQLAERVDRVQRRESSSRRGESYRGLTMGLVPPGSSPHPAPNRDVNRPRSKERRHALRTHQRAGGIRAGLHHG